MLKLFSIAAGKVDALTGVISGVSVITQGIEAIGHGIYTDLKTLEEVKNCADAISGGVQVKMDHWSGFGAIVGVLKNFRIAPADEKYMGDPVGQQQCLRADLQLLKSHPAFDQICEMCATMPESFGLSISFSGKPETIDEMEFARCDELYSVDLVDRPAANPNGLFSAVVDLNKLSKNADAATNKNFMNPLTFISDVATARKTFTAIDDLINPVLNKAGVLQLDVAGTPTQLSEAPLLARLTAFVGLLTAPEGKQREAELIASNALIAGEADTAKKNLATAIATVTGLQAEKSQLATKTISLESAVSTMTAEKAELKVQLDAALSEYSRVNNLNLGLNAEVSRKALSIGCLVDLRDAKTKELLPSTATADEKQKAADAIPVAEKLTAIFSAVQTAAARIGVDLKDKPAENAGGHKSAASKEILVGRYQSLLKEGKTAEAANFYKANLTK